MTFDAFKAEFDATIGQMTAEELQAAIKAAGIPADNDWSVFPEYSEDDYAIEVCEVMAIEDNALALAA